MKKLFFASLLLTTFVFRIEAQVDHDVNPNDVVPAPGEKLNNNQVPPVVLKAMLVDFSIDKPETWTKFPYALKEYGWVYDKDAASVRPEHFEVKMKTSDGDDLFAVYSSDGRLIQTREIFLNVDLPVEVKAKLADSQYKDWTIVGNREIIRYYHDKNAVEQHYRITVAKGETERTISFNYQANANKPLKLERKTEEAEK